MLSNRAKLQSAKESTISDLRTGQEHAPLTLAKQSILEYINNYGLSLGELDQDAISAFIAARNCERLVSRFDGTPLAREPYCDSISNLSETDTEQSKESYDSSRLLRPFVIPSDNWDVEVATSARHFPQLMPTQYASDKQVFWNKFFKGELLRREYLEKEHSEDDQSENIYASALSADSLRATDRTLRASVLLDTSHSMNNYDKRGILAKGIALATLLRCHKLSGAMHFATFKTDIVDKSDGNSLDSLKAIAKEICSVQNQGITNIQRALSTRSDEIAQGEEYKHDALIVITDGLSKLKDKISDRISLVSIVIGDLHEINSIAYKQDNISENLDILRDWSKSFHRIPQPAEYLSLHEHDLASFKQIVEQHDRNSKDASIFENILYAVENHSIAPGVLEQDILDLKETLQGILQEIKVKKMTAQSNQTTGQRSLDGLTLPESALANTADSIIESNESKKSLNSLSKLKIALFGSTGGKHSLEISKMFIDWFIKKISHLSKFCASILQK